MALVHSFEASTKDESQENMDYFVNYIIVALEMKKLMDARLYLIKASVSKHIPPLPQHNVTQLELSLMEGLHSLLKLCMNRQILNIALQKSIQSTLLYDVTKNLFSVKRLNYIENCVAQQMKTMINKNVLMGAWKEDTDLQFANILNLEEKLLGRRAYQNERLSQLLNLDTSQKDEKKLNNVQKTVDNINKLGSLLTIMAKECCNDESNSAEVKKKVLKIAAKWRIPRSLKYYKT